MFYEHERNGLPVMRPMFSQYPEEVATFAMDNQFLLSDILLVHPVATPSAITANVYFPTDLWYDIDDYTQYEGAAGYQTVLAPSDKVNMINHPLKVKK